MSRAEGLTSLFRWDGEKLFESDIEEINEPEIEVSSMLIEGVLHYQVGNGFCWDQLKLTVIF
jgi:hypothetical protein